MSLGRFLLVFLLLEVLELEDSHVPAFLASTAEYIQGRAEFMSPKVSGFLPPQSKNFFACLLFRDKKNISGYVQSTSYATEYAPLIRINDLQGRIIQSFKKRRDHTRGS